MKRVRFLMIALALAFVSACQSSSYRTDMSGDGSWSAPSVDWQNSRGYDDGE